MKIRIELPDDLYRRAKAEAVSRGRTLPELVEEGSRLVLRNRLSNTRQKARLAVLMKNACGMLDSGIPDLGSDAERLAGFGRLKRR